MPTRAAAIAIALSCAACGGGGSGGAGDGSVRIPDTGGSIRDGAAGADGRVDAVPQVFAELHATWAISDLAGAAQACPAGFPTAVLVARLDGTGPPIYDLFDCAGGAGRATYEVGSYTFELDIANNNDAVVYAASLPQAISLTADTPAAFALITDGGYYQLTWTLVSARNGAAIPCNDVAGLAAISVVITGQVDSTVSYDCAAGSAFSTVLPSGSYGATVSAVDASMMPLGVAAPLTGEMIGVQNRVTSWGSVQIPIVGR